MEVYYAAAYVRLSREDGDKAESDSISNQKDYIRSFSLRQPEIQICSEWVDDGFSGVNYERPAFRTMMEAARERKINCIIVKDFSRLGRNFIETGKYIEKIFPFLGIRFISINDGYDSSKPKSSSDNLLIPIKNLMNDSYSRDISIKIRSHLDSKRRNGKFIGPFAVYGYLKNPTDKNKLIVDEYAAGIVQDIFKMKLSGFSAQAIADCLNEKKILSPMEYKRQIGLKFSTTFKGNSTAGWSAAAILRILKNPVYIGTLIQGKQGTPNYKVKKRVDKPEEEWVVIEHNHEPVIEPDLFNNITRILKTDTRTSPAKEAVYPLAGLVCCGDCGKSMVRKNNGSRENPYFYYICSGYKSGDGCRSHSIRDVKLETAVYKAIREYVRYLLDSEALLSYIERLPYTARQVKKSIESLEIRQKELEKLQKNRLRLYEDFRDNVISKEDYTAFGRRYDKKIQDTEEAAAIIKKEIEQLTAEGTDGQQWISYYKAHKDMKKLDRRIVVELIERVEVYENQCIFIQFQFWDIYTLYNVWRDIRWHAPAEKTGRCIPEN